MLDKPLTGCAAPRNEWVHKVMPQSLLQPPVKVALWPPAGSSDVHEDDKKCVILGVIHTCMFSCYTPISMHNVRW